VHLSAAGPARLLARVSRGALPRRHHGRDVPALRRRHRPAARDGPPRSTLLPFAQLGPHVQVRRTVLTAAEIPALPDQSVTSGLPRDRATRIGLQPKVKPWSPRPPEAVRQIDVLLQACPQTARYIARVSGTSGRAGAPPPWRRSTCPTRRAVDGHNQRARGGVGAGTSNLRASSGVFSEPSWFFRRRRASPASVSARSSDSRTPATRKLRPNRPAAPVSAPGRTPRR